MGAVIKCHWSSTGYGYESQGGGCSCRIAAPPGLALCDGELAALEHERERIIARALEDEMKLAELEESVPSDYVLMLASANEKLARHAEVCDV
jgi:hypothetical protein